MRTFHGAEELKAAKGEEIGASDWFSIDQVRINTFADATEDHQWIHVDEKRAAEGPFGTTIAHGFLSLSLLPGLLNQVFAVEGKRMGINYGLNKVRFPSPVPAGSRIRATASLADITDVEGGVQLVIAATLEAEGQDKPVCVAELLLRYYF